MMPSVKSVTTAIHAIFLATCIGIVLAFFGNISGLLSTDKSKILADTPMYLAFTDPVYIYVGIIINISFSAITSIDLVLDYFSNYHCYDPSYEVNHFNQEHETWSERCFLFLLNVSTCSIVLVLHEDENIAYIYACVHAVQFVGSMGTILLLCHKLDPKHFRYEYIIPAQLCGGLLGISSILGFGHNLIYVPNLASFIFFSMLFYFLVVKICIPWISNMRERYRLDKNLSVDELCCVWYLSSTMLIILFIPGIVGIVRFCDWTNFTAPDIYVFIYTFALFSAIISSVPGRLARATVDCERRLVTVKQNLIRHISHEIRSPLNIILSGINFMVADIATLHPCREKELLEESLAAVLQTCAEAINTLDVMLNAETINSGNFTFQPAMVPCKDIVELAENCAIAAKEKGINFSVAETISSSIGEGVAASVVADVENQSPLVTALCVDKFKVRQVLRNLITNAVKFTPRGESVSVKIRPATKDELDVEEDCQVLFSDGDKLGQGYVLAGKAVVEVKRFALEMLKMSKKCQIKPRFVDL